MWGLTNQVSKMKSNTALTMDLKKNPDTRGLAPSLLRILVILFHTTLSHDKFPSTAGHSLSAVDITCPRFWKEVPISRGRPYTLNNLEVTACSSYAAKRRYFLSAPFLQCDVRRCILFSNLHGTSMSH